MRRMHLLPALAALLLLADDAVAQFVVPSPVLVPNGVGFRYRSGRLSVAGFIPTGPSVAYLPGFYGPPVYALPYGIVENHVVIQQINPAVIIRERPRVPPVNEYDVTGIDLDVEPVARLFGNDAPAVAVVPRLPEPRAKPEPPKPPPPPVAKKPQENLTDPRADLADEAKRLIELGVQAFRQEEYGRALLRFKQASEADPRNGRALFLLAQARIALGQYREAVQAIREGLRAQPDWPAARFQPRTDLYSASDVDWLEHRERVYDAHLRQPLNPDYLFVLGYLAWFNGERASAAESFRQARPLVAEPGWIDLFLKHAAAPVAAK